MYNELIKALRCKSNDINDCTMCAYHNACYSGTLEEIAADALEAAEQQIAEQQKQIAQLYMLLNNRINEIAELEAQIPKWVSVEDHLPEESGEYIVYIQMGTGVEVPDFFGSNDLSYVTSVYFKKGQKLWFDEYEESYNADLSLVDTANDFHVTHWMELPEPPKGEAQ